MEQEIWHDDLYATRNNPVKKRGTRRPTAKFACEKKLIVSDIVKIQETVKSEDEIQQEKDLAEFNRALVKATALESKIDKQSITCDYAIKSATLAYQKANIIAITDSQHEFCEQRIHLLNNMKKLWI